MRIAFGTDEETVVTGALVAQLEKMGHEVIWTARGEEWPEVGRGVGEAVANASADAGIVCCWTGTGVSIAANKVRGVRAALCCDAETARGARRWNDANVCCLSLRLISEEVGREILDVFLSVGPDEGEAPRIGRVEALP